MIPRPSLSNGFARHAGESQFPELWEGMILALVPEWMPAGSTLRNFADPRQSAGNFSKPASATYASRYLDWNGNNGLQVLTNFESYQTVWGSLIAPDASVDLGITGMTPVSPGGCQFWIDDNGATMRWGTQQGSSVVYGSDLALGRRYNFAIRQSATEAVLYVDGQEEIRNSSSLSVFGTTDHFVFSTNGATAKPSIGFHFSMFLSVSELPDALLKSLSIEPLLPFYRRRTRRGLVAVGGGGTNYSDIFGSTIFGGSVVA